MSEAVYDIPATNPRLPGHGLLVFFGDHDQVAGCEPNALCECAWYADLAELDLARLPLEDMEPLPECGLDFYRTVELPSPQGSILERLELSAAERDAYWDLRGALLCYGLPEHDRDGWVVSKLFGWGLQRLLAAWRPRLAGYLMAISRCPMTEEDRFITISDPGHQEFYSQCRLQDADTKVDCELSSGFWWSEPPSKFCDAAMLAEVVALGFSPDDSAGNFVQVRPISGPGWAEEIATLLLESLWRDYGLDPDAELVFSAPLIGPLAVARNFHEPR